MSRAMKVVVAYDGSEYADKAVESLRYAGIPDGSEIVVVSVSEWFPVPVATGGSDLLIERPTGNRDEAMRLAEIARHQLHDDHPTWEVRAEGFFGSAAREVVRYADEWGAELIVAGSHGRSAFGRFFIGSVSHQILTSAGCAVRIGRNGYHLGNTIPPNILLAVDGSDFSELILDTVTHRRWPAGTTFLIVSAAEYAYDDREEEKAMQRLHSLHEKIEGRLGELGFASQSIIDTRMIHPKEVILSEAEHAGSKCIFLGARGLTGFERFVLGSVSSTIAMRAGCSVEVVHRRRVGTDS